jgi:hypothetical protein
MNKQEFLDDIESDMQDIIADTALDPDGCSGDNFVGVMDKIKNYLNDHPCDEGC